jgi:hypothetical protein
VKLFSAYAAAELLERDRQTLTRALRSTPADGQERGQPRWKMATIVEALEKNSLVLGGKGNGGGADPRLTPLYAQFDAAEMTLRKLSTLAKRRAFAVNTLRPIIMETQRMLQIVGKANGRDPEFTNLIADKMYLLALRGLEGPCGWSQDETWDAMNFDDEDEDA